MALEAFTPEQLQIFIENEIPNISKDVLAKIAEHKIDGDLFLTLTDDYLREVAPLLGDLLRIKRLQSSLLNDASTVSSNVDVSM